MLYNFTDTLISKSLLLKGLSCDGVALVLALSTGGSQSSSQESAVWFFSQAPVKQINATCPSASWTVPVMCLSEGLCLGQRVVCTMSYQGIWFPVRTEESLSIMRYHPCQCCSTTNLQLLQTLMMKGRVKQQPLVTSRAPHFDVFLEEIKWEVVLTPGMYLLSTHSSWEWGQGEV